MMIVTKGKCRLKAVERVRPAKKTSKSLILRKWLLKYLLKLMMKINMIILKRI